MKASYAVSFVLFVSLTYFPHCCASASQGGGGFHEEDCRALSQIRDSRNKSIHESCDNWVGKNCCEWHGVECHPSLPFRVVHLDMAAYAQSYRDEQGDWYPNATLFAQLNQLTFLRLSINQIGGWVTPQALCELTHLRHLDLSGNSLDDESLPPCLWNQLSLLESLDLSWNIFNGSFGTQNALCELRHLRHLNLKGNYLDDESLPLCLWNESSSLESLDLSLNHFNGSFGTRNASCGLRKLRELKLSDNYIESLSLCNISSLKALDLSMNDLNGSNGTLNALCGLKHLRHLDLTDNKLDDESLPPCIWSELSSLQSLNLTGNNFNGLFVPQNALCGLRNLQELRLRENNFVIESFPLCLGRTLTSLEILDLPNNHLNSSFGSLNALCGMRNLKELDLSNSQVDDGNLPPCLWHNSSLLERLDLSHNNLKGSSGIPEVFCETRKLRDLFLQDNLLEDSIPPCLSEMSSLETLELSGNRFKGNIPLTFWNLSMLSFINVSNNQLEGVFSFSTFANLSTLYFIDLSNNLLEIETEFPTWVPTFQLKYLMLEHCQVNKGSGRSIPSFLSLQYHLTDLSLSHNSLQGTIPPWILYNSSLSVLSLSNNSFNGHFPKYFQNQSQLRFFYFLDISDNNIDGPLPTHIDKIFPNLVQLIMANNDVEGSIPASFGRLMQLDMLDLSNNALFGEIPDLSNASLSYLDLSNNRMHGELLLRHFNMLYLRFLNLGGNNFTGTIPTTLMKSLYLRVLDLSLNNLSGKIPSWLPYFSSLAALLLRGNNFEGQIPIQICQAKALHFLDISGNNLIGSIPSCLNQINAWKEESYLDDFWSRIGYSTTPSGKVIFTTKFRLDAYQGGPLRSMTGIDLSMNQLTGSIPFQLGDLRELHSLNLSYNLLNGPLPNSLKNMENLESLDLSHNQLVGIIPPQLVQLNSLAVFSVAFNNLSGKIPFEKQFSTFNESSYKENLGLCGPPVERDCSSDNGPSPQFQHSHKEDDDELVIVDGSLIFYSCFAISFVLGFWCVVGPLLFSGKWRKTYYKTLDRNNERLLRFGYYLKDRCFNP